MHKLTQRERERERERETDRQTDRRTHMYSLSLCRSLSLSLSLSLAALACPLSHSCASKHVVRPLLEKPTTTALRSSATSKHRSDALPHPSILATAETALSVQSGAFTHCCCCCVVMLQVQCPLHGPLVPRDPTTGEPVRGHAGCFFAILAIVRAHSLS